MPGRSSSTRFNIYLVFITASLTLPFFLLGLATLASWISFLLAARLNPFTWPLGLLAVFAQIALFYQAHNISEILLQLPFLAVTILGWLFWRKALLLSGHLYSEPISITRWFNTLFLAIIATPLFALVLASHGPSQFGTLPITIWPDAILLSLSLLALVHLSLRLTYSWSLWILVILGYSILAFFKNPQEALAYLAFLPICIYGQIYWIRYQKSQGFPPVHNPE